MATYAGYIMAAFTTSSTSSVSVTNGGGGPTAVNDYAGGNYYIAGSNEITINNFTEDFQASLQSQRPPSGSAWTVTYSTTTNKVTIDCPTDTWSLVWTDTALRDLLGFTADITASTVAVTGSNPVRGVWASDCPIFLDGALTAKPRVSDLRQTESPSGFVIGHVGNLKYRHRNVRWSHVPVASTFKEYESGAYSFERFLEDTQWGLGHTYFTPSSKVMISAHDGSFVGGTTVDGWYMKGVSSIDDCVKRSGEAWDGYWAVAVPEIVTDE
jgi:hypothetical protein